MHFAHNGLQIIVTQELYDAVEACIAVPYFNPDSEVLAALRSVHKLTIIVSEEYTVTNPYKLEELSKAATVRTVPADCDDGKLHAKVFVVTRKDGSVWAMVGSANLTTSGLTSNQEACILLDSRHQADASEIKGIATWCDDLLRTARTPNLEDAKKIFDARSEFRLEPRSNAPSENSGYWVLKTTSGSSGEDHWQKFRAHAAIAIGWGLEVDPASMTKAQLENAISAEYGISSDAPRAAAKVRKFVELVDGDIVLICKGYAPRQEKAVHVYGFARVLGPYKFKTLSDWDWFTRPAVIQEIDANIPREVLAEALGKDSLMHAIHEIDKQAFRKVVAFFGVPLMV